MIYVGQHGVIYCFFTSLQKRKSDTYSSEHDDSYILQCLHGIENYIRIFSSLGMDLEMKSLKWILK